MERLFGILFVVGIIYLAVWAIQAIIRSATHVPTWGGIIISAILGMLPLYLVLCFFGVMGEVRNEYSDYSTQSQTYAEEMSKRYANGRPSKKKRNWIVYAVLALVVISLFYMFGTDNTEEQEITTLVETPISNDVVEEPKEEMPPVVIEKKTASKKHSTQKKSSNAEMEKPLVEQKQSIAVESTMPSGMKIPQGGNVDGKTSGKQKSTLELLEERNHANVVKQAKEAGVSTEGSTLDILERISHANVVKQAKEMGVSTEGSTLEILERINRKTLEEYLK